MITNNDEFLVIHRLDYVQEQEFDTRDLGPMRMTPAGRLSLLALLYHVLDLAGVAGKALRTC